MPSEFRCLGVSSRVPAVYKVQLEFAPGLCSFARLQSCSPQFLHDAIGYKIVTDPGGSNVPGLLVSLGGALVALGGAIKGSLVILKMFIL